MKLEIKELTKFYGDFCALDHFTYTFEPGIYGILGANGAGKSTMMNMITDNLKRSSGEIYYGGKDILRLGFAYRARVGYMPQQQGMYDRFSARSFLSYMAELKGIRGKKARQEIERLLEMVNLSEHAHQKVGGFSGGMRQRVLLAQALLGSPRILILDEPTAGLDPKERIRLRGYIADLAKQRIVFITTHIVSDIESIADDVLLLKGGKLVKSGTPQQLIEECGGSNLEDVYMYFLEGQGTLAESFGGQL